MKTIDGASFARPMPFRSRPISERLAARAVDADAYDASRRWFAIALPITMAVLLYLVPILRMSAGVLFFLTLIPLLFFNAFKDPERAFYVYVAWCWMDGTLRGLTGGNSLMAVGRDLVLALIISAWIVMRMRTRYDDPIRIPPAAGPLALFSVLCVLQIANPHAISLMNSLAALKTHLSTIPLYFFAYDVFRRRGQVHSLVLFLVLATAVIGSVSMLQYVMGREWTFVHYPGTDKILDTAYNFASESDAETMNLFKPPGTVYYGGATGVFLALMAPLLCSLILMQQLYKKNRARIVGYSVMGFGFIIGIFINGLRIAVAQAIIGLVFLAFVCGGALRKQATIAVVACVMAAVVAFSIAATISGGALTTRFGSFFNNPVDALHQDRSTFFEQMVDLAVNSPVGVGLGRNGPASQFTPKDSDVEDLGFGAYSESYLGFLVLETGLPGALLIAYAAFVFLRHGYAALQRTTDPSDRLLAAGVLALQVTICANFFFGPILVQPPGSVLYWVFAAMLIRAFGTGQKPQLT